MAGMHGATLQGNFPDTFGNSLNESNLLLHVNFCCNTVSMSTYVVVYLSSNLGSFFCNVKQWKQPT